MTVRDIRVAIERLPDSAPVIFRILRGPDDISITTYFNAKPETLEVLFAVDSEAEADDE